MKRLSRAAYHREWRIRNPDKVKARTKRLYWKHRERKIKEVRAWNKRNPLKLWRYSREYYMKNRKKIIIRKRKWYQKNKYRLKVKRILGIEV